jgi:hypothetical protein
MEGVVSTEKVTLKNVPQDYKSSGAGMNLCLIKEETITVISK